MIRAPCAAASEAVQRHLDCLTKPPGSLGKLESIALRLARILGDPPTPLAERVIVVLAGDHGVARRGVSAYPSAVTRQMCRNMAAGGAAISVLARTVGARVVIADVGVCGPPVGGGVLHRRVREGTRDLSEEPALTPGEVSRSLEAGEELVRAIAPVPHVLVLGEMGIGNTTPASALTSVLTGSDPRDVVGPGTGVEAVALDRKVEAVRAGVARMPAVSREGAYVRDGRSHALRALSEVGGLEIAGLAGAAMEGARLGLPVVVDGFISSVAALAAVRLEPELSGYLFASHRSTEPGHDRVLAALGLDPMLDLRLRLGEGTGGALALPILEAAGALLRDMATFEEAGVAGEEAASEETGALAEAEAP